MADATSTTSTPVTSNGNGNGNGTPDQEFVQRAIAALQEKERKAQERKDAREAKKLTDGDKPNATHILLAALSDALTAGIDSDEFGTVESLRDYIGKVTALVGAAADSDNLTQAATFKTITLLVKRTMPA
jgi:hypothetical protein